MLHPNIANVVLKKSFNQWYEQRGMPMEALICGFVKPIARSGTKLTSVSGNSSIMPVSKIYWWILCNPLSPVSSRATNISVTMPSSLRDMYCFSFLMVFDYFLSWYWEFQFCFSYDWFSQSMLPSIKRSQKDFHRSFIWALPDSNLLSSDLTAKCLGVILRVIYLIFLNMSCVSGLCTFCSISKNDV